MVVVVRRDQRKPVMGSPAVSCSSRQWRTAIRSGVFFPPETAAGAVRSTADHILIQQLLPTAGYGVYVQAQVSSCTLRPEWTWFVINGVRSISANVVLIIDRIIVLNDRKISPRPLCNAKCHIRKRLPFILEMFTTLSSSVLTSPFYRTAPKTPSRRCNASGACGTVRALSTIHNGCPVIKYTKLHEISLETFASGR